MIQQPIFLVGAERSGATLLRLMLDSHPEISFCEEFEYSVEMVGDDGSFPDMTDFERHLEANRVFLTSGFEFDKSKTFPELIDGFLRSRQVSKGADQVGATIHFGFSKALRIWPDAKLIHIIRDPRDVSPSCMAMGWAGNVWHGLDKWIEAENEWAEIVDTIPEEQKLTVRFGDLVDNHEATLISICRYIGVEYTAQMLNYAKETEYQEPRPGLAGSWREELSDSEVQLIEARVGERLELLGFERSGLAPITVNPQKLKWLHWHDRLGRIKQRVQRFGVRLTIADLVTRFLPIQQWHRRVKLQFNEVEKAQRKQSWADGSSVRSSR